MSKRLTRLAYSLFLVTLFAAPAFAQDDEALKKDLTAVDRASGVAVRRGRAGDHAGRERLRRGRARTPTSTACTLNSAGRVVVDKRLVLRSSR
jgi:hypothetical protein